METEGMQERKPRHKRSTTVDKMIVKNCKRRLTSLAVGWIGYRKAYDMVPHSWI